MLNEGEWFGVGFPDGRVERFATENEMLARTQSSAGVSIRAVYGENGYDRISIFAQATRPRTLAMGKHLNPVASVRRSIFHEFGHRVVPGGSSEDFANAFADLFE